MMETPYMNMIDAWTWGLLAPIVPPLSAEFCSSYQEVEETYNAEVDRRRQEQQQNNTPKGFLLPPSSWNNETN
jgi:hypothetical protein